MVELGLVDLNDLLRRSTQAIFEGCRVLRQVFWECRRDYFEVGQPDLLEGDSLVAVAVC